MNYELKDLVLMRSGILDRTDPEAFLVEVGGVPFVTDDSATPNAKWCGRLFDSNGERCIVWTNTLPTPDGALFKKDLRSKQAVNFALTEARDAVGVMKRSGMSRDEIVSAIFGD